MSSITVPGGGGGGGGGVSNGQILNDDSGNPSVDAGERKLILGAADAPWTLGTFANGNLLQVGYVAASDNTGIFVVDGNAGVVLCGMYDNGILGGDASNLTGINLSTGGPNNGADGSGLLNLRFLASASEDSVFGYYGDGSIRSFSDTGFNAKITSQDGNTYFDNSGFSGNGSGLTGVAAAQLAVFEGPSTFAFTGAAWGPVGGDTPVASQDGNTKLDNNGFHGTGAVIAGTKTATGTATTTFTVDIGQMMGNTTYKVQTEAGNALSAPIRYVTNKTTTTFDVVFLAGLTGAVEFDWLVTP